MPEEFSFKGTGLTRKRYARYSGTVGTVTIAPSGESSGQAKDPLSWINEIRDDCRSCLRYYGFPDHYRPYTFLDGKWVYVEDEAKARKDDPYIEIRNIEQNCPFFLRGRLESRVCCTHPAIPVVVRQRTRAPQETWILVSLACSGALYRMGDEAKVRSTVLARAENGPKRGIHSEAKSTDK